ncbi:MAG: tRNA pseudouridine(55) synthase TruB [Bacilli bacterium]
MTERYHGVLLLDKPRGMTSHDCVSRVRRLLGTKKVGHTGTLDPDVNGVLPLCIGEATKIVQFLTAEQKRYIATVRIGMSTTTEDAEGEIVADSRPLNGLTADEVDEVLNGLIGVQTQIPPMYSAVKVNGKKLYEYARKGQTVERPVRTITIHTLERIDDVVRDEDGSFTFTIDTTCSKGTYIRTLATTIGERLGYPAHMAKLTRASSGNFTREQCLSFEQIERYVADGSMTERLLSIRTALKEMPVYKPTDQQMPYVENGAPFAAHRFPAFEETLLVLGSDDQAKAVYGHHPTKSGMIKPIRLFQTFSR